MDQIDFIGVPSQNAQRSREFYVDTLGLRAPIVGRQAGTCAACPSPGLWSW